MGMNVGFLLVNSCPTYISNFTLSRVGVAGNPPTTRYASPITLDAVMEPFVCTDKIEISNPRIDLDCQWKKPAISTQHTPYSVSGVGKQPHATPRAFIPLPSLHWQKVISVCIYIGVLGLWLLRSGLPVGFKNTGGALQMAGYLRGPIRFTFQGFDSLSSVAVRHVLSLGLDARRVCWR